MWNFIQQNHGAISAIASILTLAIWALYFQLLLNSYRHRIRPKININRGGGRTSAARCVISNMSAEAIYIEAIALTLGDGHRRSVCQLSELEVSLSSESDPRSQIFQGPLNSGEFIDIGTFDSLIDRARNSFAEQEALRNDTEKLQVMVVGNYTGDDGLIAAERSYELELKEEKRLLISDTVSTRQVRSRHELRNIEKFMLEWGRFANASQRTISKDGSLKRG
ncbi:hypothetical protein [Labrenzia sp. 011]|uniref:hypothetical protein n=1 Tax=Labrenzia sp. 011 TaxID=2171494 RepID=UPI000D519E7E|nr:hypothetical protein [Labrenzia sp. 011]PVB60041.1 hypothetical protein DCO57_19115 [Labrenzia sp. 011]